MLYNDNEEKKLNTNLYELSKEFLIKNNLILGANNVIWDKFTINGEFKCKVDKINEINVIYQNSFEFLDNNKKEDNNRGFKILDECFELFNKNKYKIVIIEDMNLGGSAKIANFFVEYLNLKNPNYVYGAYRNDPDVENFVASGEERDYKTCQLKPIDYYFNTKKEINYGINYMGVEIKHKITELFIDSGLSDIEKIKFYDLRKKSKYIRKPNEIIIFTEGYSYSSASFFIKQVQLRKGAIIVGYGGNPKNQNFDSSQNPSTIKDTEDKSDIDEIKFENYGFSLRYTTVENFKYYDKIKYPMDFEKTPIDERVNLYNKYDDSRYQEFIDEAKNIFDKYDNGKCNSKNKHIVLESDDCIFSNDPYALGGYECGDNDKWSKNCVPLYCEMGYYFDIVNQKCVKVPCYKFYEDELKKGKKKNLKEIIKFIYTYG